MLKGSANIVKGYPRKNLKGYDNYGTSCTNYCMCYIFSFNYTKNGLNSHLISQRIDLT